MQGSLQLKTSMLTNHCPMEPSNIPQMDPSLCIVGFVDYSELSEFTDSAKMKKNCIMFFSFSISSFNYKPETLNRVFYLLLTLWNQLHHFYTLILKPISTIKYQCLRDDPTI